MSTITTPAEMRELLGKTTQERWIAQLHHPKDYAGRAHAMITAHALVPLAAVVLGAEGCSHAEGRANARFIAAAHNSMSHYLDRIEEMEKALRELGDTFDAMLGKRLAIPERERTDHTWGWIDALEHVVGITRLKSMEPK